MIPVEREREIVAALTRGTPAARDRALGEFAALVRRPLASLCLRMTGEPHAAEDAVQETFVQLLRGIDSFRGEARLSTWLFRIALRASSRIRARHGRDAADALVDVGGDPGDDPARRAAMADERRRVLGAIARLPVAQRSVVALSAIQELPRAEVATILGIPVGTVDSRLHAARERLRELLTVGDGGS